MNIETIEPTDEERGEDTEAQIPPPKPSLDARMAAMRAKRGQGGQKPKRPVGRPKAPNRYKTAAPKPAQAGVGSTQSTAKGAEPPRYDADDAGNITRMSLEDRQVTSFDLPQHRKKPGWDY